jgi:hypothetical protein
MLVLIFILNIGRRKKSKDLIIPHRKMNASARALTPVSQIAASQSAAASSELLKWITPTVRKQFQGYVRMASKICFRIKILFTNECTLY